MIRSTLGLRAPARAALVCLALIPGFLYAQGAGQAAAAQQAAGAQAAGEATAPSSRAATIPAPAEVLGYEIGERFTRVDGIERYMRALAEASELVTVDAYGETLEGRPLLQVLIAQPRYRERLDEILTLNRELMDPETSEERAGEIAATNPAILYFTYGVHGNESSSPEAAMWTAHDLATDAPEVAGVLDSVIVVIDPSANPDGRDRYVNHQRQAEQLRPNPNREIRERREPWPGGRVNHYLFDLNRDWAWLSQSETRDRLVRYQRYNPQVHVDFHEMSYTSSYFFFPAADPVNDIFPEHILEWGKRFGEGNARAMDNEGLLYYTRQVFDLFYPGYGDSWPSLQGSIGMTYEQGGGGFGGLQVERPDGTVLTLRDRAFGHRTTGAATLRVAAEGKTDLLLGFARFHREIDEGLEDVYLVPGADPTRAEALVQLLRMHDIEVEQAAGPVSFETSPHPGYLARETLPEGTYRVRARQARGRLAGALLRPDNILEGASSYDITAWALPYAYGVEAHSAAGDAGGDWVPVEGPPGVRAAAAGSSDAGNGRARAASGWSASAGSSASAGNWWARAAGEGPPPPGRHELPAGPVPAGGSYGYLLPPSFSHARGLVDFLEEGGRAYAMADTFSLGGVHYPRGTVFFPHGRNDDLDRKLEAAGLGPRVTAIQTGFATTGTDLGTNDAAHLSLPRLALLGGEGSATGGFGAHWYFLEQILDLPFDAVNLSNFGSIDLSVYDVIVLPGGNPRGNLGGTGMERLEEWVRGGGTLVAVGSSARAIAGDFADIEQRRAVDEDDPDRDERLEEALRTREERELARWEDRIPGTILKAVFDPDHPLTFGAAADSHDDRIFVLSTGSAFEPDPGFESVAHFPEGLGRISGVIAEKHLERLDRSTWLAERRMGSGKVVLFADDPLFRMFWYSGWQLYTNAILVAPAF